MSLPPFALLLWTACSGPDPLADRNPEVCDNGADDDLDGRVDCNDSDCFAACAENCTDGIDNDDDALVDCDDPACDGQCPEACDDGRDNDLDGSVDCDDTDCLTVCPEDCNNNIDDDLDGLIDCEDDGCTTTCDGDADGFLGVDFGGGDCDDTNPDIHPDADEICNGGIDDDCDEAIDADDLDVVDAEFYYTDDDGDGVGSNLHQIVACSQPANTLLTAGDCDDTNPDVHPGVDEICNDGTDDDCNGLSDDDDPGLDLATRPDWYIDDDADGYGIPSAPITQCAQPPGRADNADDCNDEDPALGALETWLLDLDGDGFGAGTPTGLQCGPPTVDHVRSSVGIDCDDTDPTINPAAVDICADGEDNDCVGGDFIGCTDTAAYLSISGSADVDPLAGTYAGQETFELEGTSGAWLVCAWTWTTLDWDHDPAAVGPDPFATVCTDFDGNLCDWSYTVHMSQGAMTGGTDCAFYGLTPAQAANAGPLGYGWMSNYIVAGINYGSTMMYHNPANPYIPPTEWLGMSFTSATPIYALYDAPNGTMSYDWPDLALYITP